MARLSQVSFAGGEIAPGLQARNDLAKVKVGLAKAFNCIIHPEGGVSNRGGSRMCQEIKDSSAEGTRLITFQYNVEQQYSLEFGDYYMRVIKDGSYVYETALTITGATQADPVVLSVVNTYSNGDEVYVSGVAGMTDLNGRTFLVNNVTGTTVELQDKDGNDIDGSAFAAYVSGGEIERVYELATPYAIADVQLDPNDPTKPGLKLTQSSDTMTIVHPSYDTYDLTRSAHDNWQITVAAFEPQQAAPTGISVTNAGSGTTLAYKVTAFNDETGEESLAGRSTTTFTITGISQAAQAVVTVSAAPTCDVGDEIEIDGVVGMTELNGRRFIVDAIATGGPYTITLRDEDSTGYTAWASGGTVHMTYFEVDGAQANDSVVTFTAADGASKYNVYQRIDGLFGYVGSTQGATITIGNVDEDQTDAPPSFRNPFSGAGNKPQATTYYEQRKAFAGSTNKPQGMELSQSANFKNFTYSSPRRDDDAISRVVASRQANQIRHLIPLADLIVLTSGAEWKISAGDGEVLTPTSVIVKPQQYHGASHVTPIISGSRVLFVHRQGSRILDLGYKLDTDGYRGSDLSILAKHLFRGRKIIEWAHAEIPDDLIFAVRDDGVLLVMTYVPEQEVWAWTEHQTRGDVESVCAVEEGAETIIYTIIKRTIDAMTRRFVERFEPRDFDDIQDAFFVDCGLTYDVPMAVTGFTKANPVVLTVPDHGLSDGDIVDLSDILVTPTSDDDNLRPYAYDEINKTGWIVSGATTHTFELTDSDGVDVDGTEWRAYNSGGYARKAVTTIGGARHLAGETVVALANGDVVTGLTVSSEGEVTLQDPASRIHLGLSYFSDIETLDMDFTDDAGTSSSRKKRTPKLYLKVENTRGLKGGPSASKLTEFKQGMTELTTGIIGMSIRPSWNKGGRVYIRQSNPLPMTVLSIITRPDIEEDE